MPELPTLGPKEPKKSPLGQVFLIAVVAGVAAGGGYWFARRGVPAPAGSSPVAPSGAVALAQPSPAPSDDLGKGAAERPPSSPPPAAEPAPAADPEQPLRQAGLRHASVRVDGPLETTLVGAVGAEVGPSLTQVITRTLVWWIDVPGDLLKGDTLDVLFEERVGEEPVVHAVRFRSGKNDRTYQVYRFKAAGDEFARFYAPDGEELELRLQDSPLDSYEQITSLLKDGRRHKGVDFKAPVGTPVKAPFSGTITRKNWNWRGNGNCIELTEAGGLRRKALFLHLSELPGSVRPGRRVAKGEVLAQSGNTGRSFAPHLHYQLMSASDRVLDPFDSHQTYRRSLPPEQKAALDAEIRRLDALMARSLAGN